MNKFSILFVIVLGLLVQCGGAYSPNVVRARELEREGGTLYRQRGVGYCQAAIYFAEASNLFIADGDERRGDKLRRKAERAEAYCINEINNFWNTYIGCESPISPLLPQNYFVWGGEWLKVANYYRLNLLAQAINMGRAKWEGLCKAQYNSALQSEANILIQAKGIGYAPLIQPAESPSIPASGSQSTFAGVTTAQSQLSVEPALKDGVTQILLGNYKSAISSLQTLSSSVHATILKGFCYEMLGDKTESKAVYNSVRGDPEFGNFISLYIENLEVDLNSIDSQNKAIAKSFFNEGKKFAENGDYDKAIESFLKSYKYVPHPAILYNIGVIYESQNNPLTALVYFVFSIKDTKTRKEGAEDAINRILAQ